MRHFSCVVFIGLLFGLIASNAVGDDLMVDNIMWNDPACDLPPIEHRFPPELIPLWSKAFDRPDSELKRSAADSISIGQERKMPGLTELTKKLVNLLSTPDPDPTVRRAAARALVMLDARDRAPLLRQVAEKDGIEIAQFVEPALAGWNDSTMVPTWLTRLTDTSKPQLWRILAVQCLGKVKEQKAAEPLQQLVLDQHTTVVLRVAAARSLGAIRTEGLLAHAKQLAGDTSALRNVSCVLAIALLSGHTDGDSMAFLRELARDKEPAIAAAALNRLLEVDPKLVFDLAKEAIQNRDVNVRRAGAQALIVKADVESIRDLANLLSDTNPTLRRHIAKSFVDLAKKEELRPTILSECERVLAGEQWRGLEQALLVVVYLDHKSTSKRAIELLNHRRQEVAITAVWALRRFRLPETLPVLLAHAEKLFATESSDLPWHSGPFVAGQQYSQIFQMFGELRFKEGESLMRKFIPKSQFLSPDARAAACWALGYLYEGAAPEDLTDLFAARLSDVGAPMPEMTPVRHTCAVSLGRMKSESALPVLQQFAKLEGVVAEVGVACWWSLEQMTDQKRPPAPDLQQNILGWFLQPAG